jgi:hypothetical protein
VVVERATEAGDFKYRTRIMDKDTLIKIPDPDYFDEHHPNPEWLKDLQWPPDLGPQVDDVTAEQLRSYDKHPILAYIVYLLDKAWTGDNEERRTRARIGSVKTYVDDDGFLHIDFVTRFKVRHPDGE